jgi:hypothetical protein
VFRVILTLVHRAERARLQYWIHILISPTSRLVCGIFSFTFSHYNPLTDFQAPNPGWSNSTPNLPERLWHTYSNTAKARSPFVCAVQRPTCQNNAGAPTSLVPRGL